MTSHFFFTFHHSPFTVLYPLSGREWKMANGKCMENGKRSMVNGSEGAAHV